MRLAEIDILIVPGWTNAGPDHWQSRWLRNMKSARRVEQADWDTPICDDWVDRLVEEAGRGRRPTVIVAHSCGVIATIKAGQRLLGSSVVGALLVAPPDLKPEHDIWPATNGGFTPLPTEAFPFPSKLIGSSTDPYCSVERAQELGRAWGSDVSIIADAGHLNTASGHGPWPEGLLTFGLFLKTIG